MATARFEQKCLRCGELIIGVPISDDEAANALRKILAYKGKLATVRDAEPGCHYCTDGGVGITQVIGYRVEKES